MSHHVGMNGSEVLRVPAARPRRRRAFTLIELLVVLAVVGILSCLVLAGVQASRTASYRASCTNKMRQLGLGFQSHHSTHGIFPPQSPALSNSPGSPFTYEGIGWQIYILPFTDQTPLWEQVVQAYQKDNRPWTDPHAALREIVVPGYVCPSDTRLNSPLTDRDGNRGGFLSYVGMTGYSDQTKSGIFGRRQGVRAAEITDGLSNTIMIGERPPPGSLSMGWWYTTHNYKNLMTATDFEVPADTGLSPGAPDCAGVVTDWPPGGVRPEFAFMNGSLSNDCDKFHYWSLHPGGANFLFADGSVRFLTYAAKFQLRQFATIAGGELAVQ